MYEKDGVKLVVDNISYDFVKGATIDYAEELIRSAFVVSETYPSVFLPDFFLLRYVYYFYTSVDHSKL